MQIHRLVVCFASSTVYCRHPMQVVISELNAADARLRLPALVELLQDAVDSGASLGFLAPLAYAEAEQYWAGVAEAVAAGHRRLLVAQHPTNHEPLATVQLDLATKPNAPHRAEVMKLLVHTKARRQGLGRQLLVALEQLAQQPGPHHARAGYAGGRRVGAALPAHAVPAGGHHSGLRQKRGRRVAGHGGVLQAAV
ncbi:GNAT family N-acetyltransferase [Hymenobacter humi]|uniref:GNAT family N-acetyltransferase n=1 Tax=Hymenobacter humi TaxID=1411620 RepID=A0ABW2U589_9BACT